MPNAPTATARARPAATGRACCGWSPPDLPADSTAKARVDRLLPRTGAGAIVYFVAVAGLLGLAGHLPSRLGLVTDGVAAVAAGGWCLLNFWRCRHAHCVVSGAGWTALAVVAFTAAAIGHSLIGGHEQLGFLVVLIVALGFEAGWYLRHDTNALISPSTRGRGVARPTERRV